MRSILALASITLGNWAISKDEIVVGSQSELGHFDVERTLGLPLGEFEVGWIDLQQQIARLNAIAHVVQDLAARGLPLWRSG